MYNEVFMKWYLGFALKQGKKWEGIDETRLKNVSNCWHWWCIQGFTVPLSLSPFIYMFKMFYKKVKNKNK